MTEEAGVAERRLFEQLVTDSPAGVIVTDQQGVVQFVNDKALGIFGRRRDELLGEPFGFSVREGETSEIEIHRDGARRYAELRVASVQWQDAPALLASINDVTDQRQINMQLRQAQKMQALGTLAGGIAHDFNNVLAAIVGNAEVLQEELPPDDPARRFADEIAKAGRRARDLVARILAFSRPQEPNRCALDLREIVDEALKLVAPTLPAGIEIRTEFPDSLSAVEADATSVHQVVVNLCTNASHAIGKGPGHVDLKLQEIQVDASAAEESVDLRPGCYVRLSIADDGCGMDKAVLERVFEPFFSTKGIGKGTGLGLSVVHGIMKSHYGAVTAESEPGKGTTFNIFFPAAPTALSQSTTESVAPERGRGERVMYLDDDEALVFLIPLRLERLGYQARGFLNASVALAELREKPDAFDIVVTDLNMPGMSGLQVVEEVLSIRPDLPVIMASGSIRAEDVVAAKRAGARDLIYKPTSIVEIAEALHILFAQAP